MCRSALFFAFSLFTVLQVHCAVDGSWGAWSEWSSWARGLCSGNQRVKTRPCTNPVPSSDGQYCVGDNAINEPGSVDGGWGDWSQWSTCTKPCGGSVVNRTRACNNPTPAYGGKNCSGSGLQHKLECLAACPDGRVDGGYGEWGYWSACPSQCSTNGGARVRRSRRCDTPTPMNGGSPCKGPATEEILSCFNKCPINGGFSQWSLWSECSTKCGTGVQTKGRLCNNPEPKGVGAKNCVGQLTETKSCRLAICQGAVNGSWSDWSQFGACSSQYCMKGEKLRTRTCTNPSPANGGDLCPGSAKDTRICPYTNCLDFNPTPVPSVPVSPGSFMARECGATEKYTANGIHKSKVPGAVYNHLSFKKNNFMSGYFAMQSEEKGKIIKYCFDPIPAVTIKEVADNLVTSYRGTKAILGYTKPDEQQPILGFSIRVRNESGYPVKGYEFGLQQMEEFSPGHRMSIKDVLITYYTEGTYRSYLAKGKLEKFKPSIYDVIVYRNSTYHSSTSPLPPGGLTSMTGKTKGLTFQGIFHGMGFRNLPSFMIKALQAMKVWDLTFETSTIGYDFFQGWQSSLAPFRLTATKFIGGIPIHFEVIAAFSFAQWLFAVGVVFDGESFGAAMGKISGSRNEDGGFFDSIGIQVELGLVVNPTSDFRLIKTSTAFTKQPLHELGKRLIKEGFQAAAQVRLPSDCGGSSFCEVCKRILGPKVTFRIAAHLKTGGYLKVSAGFYKIKLAENYWFWKAELFFEKNMTKKETKLGFAFEIKIPINQGEIIVDGIAVENELRLGGQVKHTLGKSDIEGQLFMRGMWRNAFGSDWFAIGNINIGLTITVGSPTGITGFQFGGQLEFGKNCLYDADFENDGHCLMIRIYFGWGKPSYFFGEISALTIGKLIRMFGGKTSSVPEKVAASGFPKGALVSYSPQKEIDLTMAGGPYVYKGTRVKGTLNFAGYEIKVEVRVSEDEVYFEGEIDPINLGGVLMITRNATHSNLGPKALFHYRKKMAKLIPLPYFKFFFEGYGKFFGIEAYAFINITMQGFEIYVYGKAWNLIYAELYISASYDIFDITNAHFYVRVIVDLRGLTDEVMQLKCQNCYSLKCKQAEDNCKGFLDKAGKWIGGVINAAGKWIKKTARKIRDGLAKVGKAIKKFFSGWRRRRSIINRRNENFDLHIRNRRFISKLICEGLVGGGCRGIEHLCSGTCKALNFIGQGLCKFLDIAVGALKVAEAVVGWVNAAIQFVMQMFLIHGIRFELGLGKRFGGGFMIAAEIDLTLFAQRMHFGFEFDLQHPARSILSAKDSGMYKYKKGLKQPRTSVMYNAYDPPNPFTDFDLTGAFGIESTQSGEGSRLGSCMAVTDKTSGSKIVLKGCNSTDTKQQWTYTLKGAIINAYSQLCLDLSSTQGADVVQKTCNDRTDNQRYDCDVVTRTLKRRRSDRCVTAAKISPSGPGSLSHLGSLKCIHVNPTQRLMLRSACQRADTEFVLKSNGHLVATGSGYCVRPVYGNAVKGAQLEMVTSGCHAFAFTDKGSLKHKASNLCIQTATREMKPADNTVLVLGTTCDSFNSSQTLPDAELSFSFIPTNKHMKMEPCGIFDDMRIEQRFQVMNEELASVCSKFSHDIAMHKTAVQSSTNYNGFANRAVDGNFKFKWADKSCTHTNDEQDPWWRVDLGQEYIVTDITIINRAEYGDRFKNIQVHVGKTSQNHKNHPVCHDRVKQAFDGEAVRLQCNPPIPGRYVSVQMYGKGILSMCEVIVNSRLGGISDWCQIENGGCDQICVNHCDKKTTCKCLPGYQLAYDQKTCIDVNECLSNNGGCRRDTKAYCSNYPGGYYCGCEKGYILKDNSLAECMDVNECGSGNGGCEQMCNNTVGSYLCTCRAGFQRDPSTPYGCIDIDECATNNSGCEHNCNNYDGGYYCSCRSGYRLGEDNQRCEEIFCKTIEAPARGVIAPSICTERYGNIAIGTNCKVNCTQGFEIVATPGQPIQDTTTCLITGTWNRAPASCHPVKCSSLKMPLNGGLVPASCHQGQREYGQRCVSYCKHGYKIQGPTVRYCQSNKQWSSSSETYCVPIVAVPYLNCPVDIQLTLPSNKGSISLGYKFPEPQTNMKIISVSHPRNFSFPVGTTIVKFAAEDIEGTQKLCSVLVDVLDKTPPKVVSCPSDIVHTLTTAQALITWTPPVFTDNVGIARLELPTRKPGEFWRLGESTLLQYRAIDTSGNAARCTFRVTIRSDNCGKLSGDEHISIRESVPNRQYSMYCTNQRILFGPFGFFAQVAFCRQSNYYIHLNGKDILLGLRAPDCVEYMRTTAAGACPAGKMKFSIVDDWWGTHEYYCSNCPAGTYHNATLQTCVECPMNTYQNEQGRSSCEMCPKFSNTAVTGARNINHCIAQCKPGSFSPSGLNETSSPCQPCPKGSYSELDGRTECETCPAGTTTVSTGSQNMAQCVLPPSVNSVYPSEKVTTKVGSDVTLECYFKGTPSPSTRWTKLNGALPVGSDASEILNINMEKVGMMLELSKVTAADSGVYQCHVQNAIGSHFKSLSLTVA
eukprot:gene12584-3284_t